MTMSSPGEHESDATSAVAPTQRPIAMLITGLSLLALVVLMAVTVGMNPGHPWTQGIDDAWRAFIGRAPDDALVNSPYAMFFQNFGDLPGYIAFAAVIPLALVALGRWRSALFWLASLGTTSIVLTQVGKKILERPRPAVDAAAGLWGPVFKTDHGSFPSGHSVAAAAVMLTAFALIGATHKTARTVWLVLSVIVMVSMAWQRTLTNAHWLSDTLAGLVLGIGGTLIMWWAFWPWVQRDHGRPIWFLNRNVETSDLSIAQ